MAMFNIFSMQSIVHPLIDSDTKLHSVEKSKAGFLTSSAALHQWLTDDDHEDHDDEDDDGDGDGDGDDDDDDDDNDDDDDAENFYV